MYDDTQQQQMQENHTSYGNAGDTSPRAQQQTQEKKYNHNTYDNMLTTEPYNNNNNPTQLKSILSPYGNDNIGYSYPKTIITNTYTHTGNKQQQQQQQRSQEQHISDIKKSNVSSQKSQHKKRTSEHPMFNTVLSMSSSQHDSDDDGNTSPYDSEYEDLYHRHIHQLIDRKESVSYVQYNLGFDDETKIDDHTTQITRGGPDDDHQGGSGVHGGGGGAGDVYGSADISQKQRQMEPLAGDYEMIPGYYGNKSREEKKIDMGSLRYSYFETIFFLFCFCFCIVLCCVCMK